MPCPALCCAGCSQVCCCAVLHCTALYITVLYQEPLCCGCSFFVCRLALNLVGVMENGKPVVRVAPAACEYSSIVYSIVWYCVVLPVLYCL